MKAIPHVKQEQDLFKMYILENKRNILVEENIAI